MHSEHTKSMHIAADVHRNRPHQGIDQGAGMKPRITKARTEYWECLWVCKAEGREIGVGVTPSDALRDYLKRNRL